MFFARLSEQCLGPHPPPPDELRETCEHQMPHWIVPAACASCRASLAPQRARKPPREQRTHVSILRLSAEPEP